MSTEGGGGDQTSKKKEEEAVSAGPLGSSTRQQQTAETGESSKATEQPKTEPIQEGSGETGVAHAASGKSTSSTSSQGVQEEDKKLPARTDQPSDVVVPSSSSEGTKPRQVIAVSASKGPAAFFNLARKFLVTDEMCDLSALEGAIVSAVDAAHLLERSKLATIVRIQTSYVTVEPKRKKQPQQIEGLGTEQQTSAKRGHVASVSTVEGAVGAYAAPGVASVSPQTMHQPHYVQQQHHQQYQQQPQAPPRQRHGKGSGGRELRRARIVITVKRTEEYRQWLEENPLQAVIAGDGDDVVDSGDTPPAAEEPRKPPR